MGSVLVTIFTSQLALHSMFTSAAFFGMTKVGRMSFGRENCVTAMRDSEEQVAADKVENFCSTFNLANGLILATQIIRVIL